MLLEYNTLKGLDNGLLCNKPPLAFGTALSLLNNLLTAERPIQKSLKKQEVKNGTMKIYLHDFMYFQTVDL